MDTISIYRKMATRWLEIAQRVENLALKKCYVERALRYRAMVTRHEREAAKSKSPQLRSISD